MGTVLLRSQYPANDIKVKRRKKGDEDGYDPVPHEGGEEKVVLDLTAGKAYTKAGSAEPLEIEPQGVEIAPGDCMIIETAEHFEIGRGVFGQLCSIAKQSFRGVMVANTKIDPAFVGHLKVAVHNASSKPISIEEGVKFCSVYFMHLDGTADGDRRIAPKAVGRATEGVKRRIRRKSIESRDWLAASVPALVLSGIFTLLFAGLKELLLPSHDAKARSTQSPAPPSTSPSVVPR